MITLYDFQAMSFEERLASVYEATFIGDRSEGSLFVQFYNMGTFYAELYYSTENNEVVRVRGFKSIKQLDPYLNVIKLNF